MPYTFKVEFDQDGNAIGVEPPRGANCGQAIREGTPAYLAKEQNARRKKFVKMEIWDMDDDRDDPCVKLGNMLWCW